MLLAQGKVPFAVALSASVTERIPLYWLSFSALEMSRKGGLLFFFFFLFLPVHVFNCQDCFTR